MKYKYILFDLDGTLSDSKVGITKSVQYALKKFDILEDDLSKLEKFAGPPLKDSFMKSYSFSEEKSLEAIELFREYFREKGIYENQLYSDIAVLLTKLREAGCILGISTSKPQVFTEIILEEFSIREYFDVVVGSELDGSRSDKTEIISYTLELLGNPDLKEVVMIGDREHDIIGAVNNHIDSVGILHGYGEIAELKRAGATYIVKDTLELSDFFS